MRAVCTPDDVAEAIVALATGSRMVTGTIQVIDGGMCIQGFTPAGPRDAAALN
jgi:NAD(P)-dependent dehydrogenase (short-subunit alcohol dehydrogenase family)